MLMKSYVLFLFASVLLVSASPMFPPTEDQELSSRSFETDTATPLKRQNTESGGVSLFRKILDVQAYLLKRVPPKNTKQVAAKAKHDKTIRKHDEAIRKHDKEIKKHDKAVAKHDQAIRKHDKSAAKHDKLKVAKQPQVPMKNAVKKQPQAPMKNAVKTQGAKQKTLVKNNKKSSASALEPALSVLLFAKMLAYVVMMN